MTEPESTARKGLDTAITIFLFTAFSYALAFCYAAGYANYFLLPMELVDVNIKYLLFFGGSLTSLFWFIAAANTLPAWQMHSWPPAVRKSVFTLIVLVVGPAIPILVLFGLSDFPWLLILELAAIVAAYEFGVPLLLYPKHRSYVEKLNAAMKFWQKPSTEAPLLSTSLARRLGRVGPWVVFGGPLALAFVFMIGFRAARIREEFLVTTVGEPCAVLLTNGDLLVCGEFDRQTHRTNAVFHFLSMKDGKDSLRLQRTGALLPPDDYSLKTPESLKEAKTQAAPR